MSDTPLKFTIDDEIAPASQKPRRGRPPGSKNGSGTRTANSRAGGATDAKTLEQALSSMESLYNMGAMGLQLVGLTQSAETLAGQIDGLRDTNREALKASPRLASAIANAGSIGGATAFFIGNAMALAPVMMVARAELFTRRAAAEQAATDAQQDDNVTRLPGA